MHTCHHDNSSPCCRGKPWRRGRIVCNNRDGMNSPHVFPSTPYRGGGGRGGEEQRKAAGGSSARTVQAFLSSPLFVLSSFPSFSFFQSFTLVSFLLSLLHSFFFSAFLSFVLPFFLPLSLSLSLCPVVEVMPREPVSITSR